MAHSQVLADLRNEVGEAAAQCAASRATYHGLLVSSRALIADADTRLLRAAAVAALSYGQSVATRRISPLRQLGAVTLIDQ
jgi:hypothetical protein